MQFANISDVGSHVLAEGPGYIQGILVVGAGTSWQIQLYDSTNYASPSNPIVGATAMAVPTAGTYIDIGSHFSSGLIVTSSVGTAGEILVTYKGANTILPGTLKALAGDNFNRADGALGSNWSAMGSWSAPVISGNQVKGGGAGASGAIYSNISSWPNDQWSQVTIAALDTGAGSNYGGVAVRANGVAASTTGYFLIEEPDSGTHDIILLKFKNGTPTTLDSGLGTPKVGDVLRLSVAGSVVTGYLNGAQITQKTDADIASGSPGVAMYNNLSTMLLDNWLGGI